MNRITYFSECLKDMMIEKAITVAELSQKSGVNVSRIYDYLSGKAPATHNAIKIARVLKCTLDYLFGFDTQYVICNEYVISSDCTKRFREAVENSGKSRYRIANDMGITQTQLSNWYLGKQTPKLISLIDLADYFNCSLDYLVGR